jgi:hypothetical protein
MRTRRAFDCQAFFATAMVTIFRSRVNEKTLSRSIKLQGHLKFLFLLVTRVVLNRHFLALLLIHSLFVWLGNYKNNIDENAICDDECARERKSHLEMENCIH